MKGRKIQKKLLKILILILITIIALSNGIVQSTNSATESSENWDEWQKEDYWEWHTRTTTNDKAYNGNHIVINNNVIDFYGYGQNSYKDFLYKNYEKPGKKIFKFRIDESKANYHTLDGAGFIFNATKKNNKLSGYILLFRENDVCIYKIDNIDINTFETGLNATIATYGELIESKQKTASTTHDLIVEATPTNIKITEGENEILNINLDYSEHVGESFGLISSYVQHDCSILSKIQFSEIEMIIEDYKILVLNTDMNNNPLQGGYFELKNESGNIVKEERTNENGIFYLEDLTEGIYTIQQKEPPSGYVLNDTIYKFKIINGGKVVDVDTAKEIDLIIKNEKNKIEINNKLINTDSPISGTKIGLYDKDGNQISIAVTDKDGKAIFTEIVKGNYKYKQLEVPDGYELNTNEYTCTVNIDGSVKFGEEDKGIIYNKKISNSTTNNSVNNSDDSKDTTRKNTVLPNAGIKTNSILAGIILIIILGIYLYIKLKEYKIVK